MSSLVIAKTALTSAEILHNRMGVIQLVCADSTGLRLAWNIDRRDRQYRQYIQINTDKLSCQNCQGWVEGVSSAGLQSMSGDKQSDLACMAL